MRAEAKDFEQVWAAHAQGAETAAPGSTTVQLVAVAEGIRSLALGGDPAPVERAWARLADEIESPLVPLPHLRPIVLRPRHPRRRALVRTLAAAVALFAGVASISLRAHPGSFLYPLRTGLEQTALFFDGSLHLRIAKARLGDLVEVLENGPQSEAPSLASRLVFERSSATQSGQDVSSLDAAIRSEVPPALSGVPLAIARQVQRILDRWVPATALRPPPAASGGGSDPSASSGPVGTSSGHDTSGSHHSATGGASGTFGDGGRSTSPSRHGGGNSGDGGQPSGGGGGSLQGKPPGGDGSDGSSHSPSATQPDPSESNTPSPDPSPTPEPGSSPDPISSPNPSGSGDSSPGD